MSYRYMNKSELARLAGVSLSTFSRYLKTRCHILTRMGISPHAQKLPPSAIKFLAEDYGIDIPEESERKTEKFR